MSKAGLRYFQDPDKARARARTANVTRQIQVLPVGPGYHLKQVGADSIEPTFLCEDGRWRRYDLVADFDQ